MERIKNKKRILAVLTIALAMVMVLSCVIGIFGDRSNIKEYVGDTNDIEMSTTALPTTPTTGGYSHFNPGVQFVFTDKNKIVNFRAGTNKFDFTTVVVSGAAGTQTNPHVITTVAEWEHFVKDMASGSNGAGDYFALGADLDFEGVDFHPVATFKGTFYGLNCAIKNITCSAWKYYNGSSYVDIVASTSVTKGGCGLFCNIENATITDLVVQDYKYMNMPQNSTGCGAHGPFTAGIAGFSSGNNDVLNCHAFGTVTSNINYTVHPIVGGIIGMHSSVNNTVFAYRCSAQINMAIDTTTQSLVGGGIVGYPMTNSIAKIYDCAANLKASGNWKYDNTGSCCGWTLSAVEIENFVGIEDLTSTVFSDSGALLGAGHSGIKVKNVYVEGHRGADGDKKSEYAVYGNSSLSAVNVSNINVVIDTPDYPIYGTTDVDPLPSGTANTYGSSALMLTDAKAFFGAAPYSNIWDTDKIGGTYDPDNSPVRNSFSASITFKNLLSGDNEENITSVPTAEYKAGAELPNESNNSDFEAYINSKANHVFKGWTMDKTGNTAPYTKLPNGVFGDVIMYAVWGVPSSYITSNVTTSITSDKDKIEYDGEDCITLTAKLTHTKPASGGMTNPTTLYYFTQDMEEKTTTASVKTSGILKVTDHLDSGTYSFNYRLADGLEPLWFYDGSSSATKEIDIEKAKLEHLTVKDFKISASTVPYFGKPLGEIEFTAKLINKANKEVTLKVATEDKKTVPYKWNSSIGKVDVKGTNTKKIVFFPEDTDNYETQYAFDQTFDSESLLIVFNLDQISQVINVEVEYGQYYGAAEIIYLFEQAYLVALGTWDAEVVSDVSSMAPYLDGKSLVTGTPEGQFATAFNGINEEKTIEVTFKSAEYEIIFDPDNDGATSPTKVTRGYGQFLEKPLPDPVKGEELFIGWYFDDITIDNDGKQVTTRRAWRFNSVGDLQQDRVTRSIMLTAEWITADKLLDLTVEVNASKKFIAQKAIEEGDLIVTAIYGSSKNAELRHPVILDMSQYTITYTSSLTDKMLHVKDYGFDINVSYTFGGDTKDVDVNLTVNPQLIDTSKATFSDKTIMYNGADQPDKIDAVTWSGARPSQITGVTYVYTLDGEIIDENDPKGVGDYIVQAVFTTRSKDFYAEPMYATLRITNQAESLRPKFVGGVEYDGTVKNVEDYLDNYDSAYMKITGVTTQTEVGKYRITVTLTDGTWPDGGTDPVSIEWEIEKSTLIPEWDSWEFVMADSTGTGFAPKIIGIYDGLADADASVDLTNAFVYKLYDVDGNPLSESQVGDMGSYRIVASIDPSGPLNKNYRFDGVSNVWDFVVVPESGMDILTIEWSDTEFLYDGNGHRPSYVVKDRNGNVVTDSALLDQLIFNNYVNKTEVATYTVKVTVKDSERYFIRSGSICKFKIVNELGDNPPEESNGTITTPSGNDSNGGAGTLDEILKKLKEIPLWQLIASVISIILIIIFVSKTVKYDGERKKFNKKSDKLEKSIMAVAPFLGIAESGWTTIACVLMVLAVATFIIMLVVKKARNKAEEEYEDLLDEYNRNQKNLEESKRAEEKENMRMMLMGMMGGNNGGQGGYAGGYGLGADEIRGIVSDTMAALLPGMQQLLPQQASSNDEVVQKLIEQNEKLMEQNAQNEERVDKLIQQLAARPEEREVASASVNDDTLERLADKLQPASSNGQNDETIKQMLKNQEMLMSKILELSANGNSQPQVVEKVVEVPVEVEKIVEVPVEVEKIVEKEVVKEVPVEVEKIVEKEVVKEVAVATEPKPKKEFAPRLTLDEAYALLSKTQKKYFDGLKAYALSKDKCKEKKSTYFVTFGPATTNPILKLAIKKDTTVALLKMEDEFMKDIRRDASGDGTKVKVKETEITVSDAQAFETAKRMIDLREDQIERYQELLKEQRSAARNKK